MMEKLDYLKSKYEGVKYEPVFSCVKCGGVGEYINKKGDLVPCLCIYIDPSIYKNIGGEILESLQSISTKGLAELAMNRESEE
jgi:hypothetical protein